MRAGIRGSCCMYDQPVSAYRCMCNGKTQIGLFIRGMCRLICVFWFLHMHCGRAGLSGSSLVTLLYIHVSFLSPKSLCEDLKVIPRKSRLLQFRHVFVKERKNQVFTFLRIDLVLRIRRIYFYPVHNTCVNSK